MTIEPGLYVTATPIGNLKDITLRAIEALKSVDLILCEDTRQTQKLCRAYGVKTALQAYHDHNAARSRPAILKKLSEGAAICLVSDAGTPLISDPGYKLVREARDLDIPIIPLPGPSAAIAALAVAGAPSDQFLFAGFPPAKIQARKSFFQSIAQIEATLIFYETGPRLADSLKAMAETLGDRKTAIARELTKMHEEVIEETLRVLASRYENNPPKGEIVVIVHPARKGVVTPMELENFLRDALVAMSVKDAATAAADALGVPKKQAYEIALKLKSAN